MGTNLAIFYVHITPMLPTEFQVNWTFVSGKEKKSRFSKWQPWWPSWISDWNNFSYFLIYKSYQVSSQLAFLSGAEDFQESSHGLHLGFPIGTILAIFDL